MNAESDHLSQGTVTATITVHRAGVVVLSSSFDPGWTATVDGRSQPTEMVAPALVATTVEAGVHRVVFRHRGFRGYPLLVAVSAGVLLEVPSLPPARIRERPSDPAGRAGPTPRGLDCRESDAQSLIRLRCSRSERQSNPDDNNHRAAAIASVIA